MSDLARNPISQRNRISKQSNSEEIPLPLQSFHKMKKPSFLFILLLLFLSEQSQTPDCIGEIKKTAEWEKKAFLKKLSSDTRGVGNNYDLKYHRCEWNIDPNVYYISGNVTSYFVPVSSGFVEIDFDF